MDTEQRLALLEKQVAEHETLVQKLILMATTTAKGRILLRMLGVDAR